MHFRWPTIFDNNVYNKRLNVRYASTNYSLQWPNQTYTLHLSGQIYSFLYSCWKNTELQLSLISFSSSEKPQTFRIPGSCRPHRRGFLSPHDQLPRHLPSFLPLLPSPSHPLPPVQKCNGLLLLFARTEKFVACRTNSLFYTLLHFFFQLIRIFMTSPVATVLVELKDCSCAHERVVLVTSSHRGRQYPSVAVESNDGGAAFSKDSITFFRLVARA